MNMVTDGDPESALIETALEQECDLTVVGAYGHSRIREMILGSSTAYLATHAPGPVLTNAVDFVIGR